MPSWLFPQIYRFMEKDPPKLREARAGLFTDLTGTVLEVGAGLGYNFQFYPPGVSVTATDYNPHMIRKAQRRAATAPVPVELQEADVQALPFEDNSFDHTVVTLVFCSVPDAARGLAEVARVTRPGGTVRMLEHVRSDSPRVWRMQRWVTPVWKRFGDGCELHRDTVSLVEASPLVVDEVREAEGMPRFVPMRTIRAHVAS